jgi:hypothetical protein
MRKRPLAAIAVVAVLASAHAERKQDILGVRGGMSYQEVMSAMAKICKGKPEALESANGAISLAHCSPGKRLENPTDPLDEDRLDVLFAVHISQRPVDVVRYFFQNNAEISDLVESLFAQFGFPCEPRPGYETCYPTQLYRGASSPTGKDFITAFLLLDPPTKIELTPSSGNQSPELWPSLNMFPGDYGGILELRDVKLSDAENAAREAEHRAPPKFWRRECIWGP